MDTVVFQCLECVISQLGVQEGVDVLNAVKRKSHTHNIQVFCDAAVIIKGENGALLQIHLHMIRLLSLEVLSTMSAVDSKAAKNIMSVSKVGNTLLR